MGLSGNCTISVATAVLLLLSQNCYHRTCCHRTIDQQACRSLSVSRLDALVFRNRDKRSSDRTLFSRLRFALPISFAVIEKSFPTAWTWVQHALNHFGLQFKGSSPEHRIEQALHGSEPWVQHNPCQGNDSKSRYTLIHPSQSEPLLQIIALQSFYCTGFMYTYMYAITPELLYGPCLYTTLLLSQ